MLDIFLEKYLPGIIVAILIGVLLINPKKWDGVQRVSLGVAAIALVVFASRTLSLKNSPRLESIPPKSSAPPVPPYKDDASTTGDQSPANTGDGNNFIYGSSPKKLKSRTQK